MLVGIANPRWRVKRSWHPRCIRNPQFYVFGKRPMSGEITEYIIQRMESPLTSGLETALDTTVRIGISWWRHQMETFFRVTGLLCGEFTGHRWIPLTEANDAELCYFFYLRLWVNNREAGDLRRHRTHYDDIVMYVELRPNSETRNTYQSGLWNKNQWYVYIKIYTSPPNTRSAT